MTRIAKSILMLGGLTLAFAAWGETEPATAKSVELSRYLGTWYEIASIPQKFQAACTGGVTAEYSTADDGLIRVVNSCDTASGKRQISEGRARVVDPPNNAKLAVTFEAEDSYWNFDKAAPYWILDVAPDYSYALVGHPQRQAAWILSRATSLPSAVLMELQAKLKASGYDSCTLMTTVQEGGFSTRRSLCESGAALAP